MKLKYIGLLASVATLVVWGCQSQTPVDDRPDQPETIEEIDDGESQQSGSERGALDTSDYELVEHPEVAGVGLEFLLVDGAGDRVELPEDVAEGIRHSLPVLFDDGRYVVYIERGSGKRMVYDLHAEGRIELDSVDYPDDADPIDFHTYGEVSPDQRHLLVIVGNYGGERWAYLIVYTIEDGELVATRKKTDVLPHVRCFAGCHVDEMGFKDNDTAYYLEQANEPAPTGDERVIIEVPLEEMSQQ